MDALAMIDPEPSGDSEADLLSALLAAVFATLVPATIMTALFAIVGGLVAYREPGATGTLLYGVGLTVGTGRLLLMRRYAGLAGDRPLADADLRSVERRFACAYLSFAGILGLFASHATLAEGAQAELLASVLVTGFAAGVATGVASRPRIAVAAMLLGVGPVIVAAALRATITDMTLAGMMLAFLIGGIRSTLVRHQGIVGELRLRERHAALARRDPLTGLANRLAVEERLAHVHRCRRPALVVCVDLDGFKAVNDVFGHAAGDALLVEVGRRLRGLVRATDLVARLGGDEFMLVCEGSCERHEMIAQQIAERLTRPFSWYGQQTTVGASVGMARLPPGGDVDRTRAMADEELYRIKRAGGHRRTTADRRAGRLEPDTVQGEVRAGRAGERDAGQGEDGMFRVLQ